MSWRVEWHFDNADPPIQIVSEGLLDNLPILDHIQSILSPEPVSVYDIWQTLSVRIYLSFVLLVCSATHPDGKSYAIIQLLHYIH